MVFYNTGNMKKINLNGSIHVVKNGKNTINGHDSALSVIVSEDQDLSKDVAEALGANKTVSMKDPQLGAPAPPIPPKPEPEPEPEPEPKPEPKKESAKESKKNKKG